jgi:peroxiredoxin
MAARGQWIAVGTIVTVLAAAIVAGMALSPDVRPVRPGSEAPDFQALNLENSETVRLSDHEGEVILLNLWATWCPPCEREMPYMQHLHETLGPAGLKIIAVSLDATEPGDVQEWVRERSLTFDIWHNRDGHLEGLYQTTGLPESFVIDRDGIIVKKEIGAREWDSPAQVAFFERLLARGGASYETSGPNARNP